MKRLDPSSDKRYNKIKVRHQRKDLDQRRLRATEFSQKQVQEPLPTQKGRPGHKNASSYTRAVREFGERRHNFDTKAYSEVMKKPTTVTKGRLSLQKAGLFMRGKVSSVARRDSPLTELNQARLDDDLHRIIRLANADDGQGARSRARNGQPDVKYPNTAHRNSFAGSKSSPISDAMSDYNNSQRVDDPPTPTFEEAGRKERGKRPIADEEKDFWADLSIVDSFSPKYTSTCRKPRPSKRPPCQATIRDVPAKKHPDHVRPLDSDVESVRSCSSNGSAVNCGARARDVAAKKHPDHVRPPDSDVESVRSCRSNGSAVNCGARARDVAAKKHPDHVRPPDSDVESVRSCRSNGSAVNCGARAPAAEVGSYKQFAHPVKEFLREFQEEDYWNKPKLSVLESGKSKLRTLFNKLGRVALEKDANTILVESPATVVPVTPENLSSAVDVEIDASKPLGNRTNHNRTSVIQRNIPSVTAAFRYGSTQSVAPPVPQYHQLNGVAAQQDVRIFPSALQRHRDRRQYARTETNSTSKQRATEDNFRRPDMNRFYDDRNLQQTEVNGTHRILPVYPSSSDGNANAHNNAPASHKPATPLADHHDEFFFSPYVPLDPVITNPLEYLEQTLGESHNREKARLHPGYDRVERRDARITEPLRYPEGALGDREKADRLHPGYDRVERRDARIAEPLRYPEGALGNQEKGDRLHPGYDRVERRDARITEPLRYPDGALGDREKGDRLHPGYDRVERRDARITEPLRYPEGALGDQEKADRLHPGYDRVERRDARITEPLRYPEGALGDHEKADRLHPGYDRVERRNARITIPLQGMGEALGDDRNWKEDARYRPGYDAVERRDMRGIRGYDSTVPETEQSFRMLSSCQGYKKNTPGDSPCVVYERSPGWNDFRDARSQDRDDWQRQSSCRAVVNSNRLGLCVVRRPPPSDHRLDSHQSGFWRDRSSPSQRYSSDLDRESRSRRLTGAKRRSDSGFSSWAEEDRSESHLCKNVTETPACVFQPRYMS